MQSNKSKQSRSPLRRLYKSIKLRHLDIWFRTRSTRPCHHQTDNSSTTDGLHIPIINLQANQSSCSDHSVSPLGTDSARIYDGVDQLSQRPVNARLAVVFVAHCESCYSCVAINLRISRCTLYSLKAVKAPIPALWSPYDNENLQYWTF